MNSLIPVAVIVLVLYGLHRWRGAEMWILLVAVVLGVILSSTVVGPDIHNILSQLSGGRLH
jgi:type IV secretory pathway VirB2 component (pilin)